MHAMPSLMGLFINSISVNDGRKKLFESTHSSTLKFILNSCLSVHKIGITNAALPLYATRWWQSKELSIKTKPSINTDKTQESKPGDNIVLQQLESLFSCIILREGKKRLQKTVLLKADMGMLQQLRISYGRHQDLN